MSQLVIGLIVMLGLAALSPVQAPTPPANTLGVHLDGDGTPPPPPPPPPTEDTP